MLKLNSKLLAIFLSVLLVSLSGCNNHEVKPSKDGEQSIYVYTVEGQALECISLHYRLSCNWPKYNKLKKAN
jgi:uncharacterized lipoprotein YehR (DUF1307 family)